MVMQLGSTRWTSTSATPFGPAPGGGIGQLHDSGFSAQRTGEPGTVMDPLLVLGRGPFTVRRQTVSVGETPAMVIQFRYTDRGALTKAQLDQQVQDFLKKAGYKVSRTTSFKPQSVTWRWEHDKQADFYFPVVDGPAALSGMRYAGNAVSLPVYQASADLLAKLPNSIYLYTVAVTSPVNEMNDGNAAQVLTLLKQAMVNMAPADAYANVLATLKGVPASLFGPVKRAVPLAKAGMSGLILIAAWNMLSPHIGSERLA